MNIKPINPLYQPKNNPIAKYTLTKGQECLDAALENHKPGKVLRNLSTPASDLVTKKSLKAAFAQLKDKAADITQVAQKNIKNAIDKMPKKAKIAAGVIAGAAASIIAAVVAQDKKED